MTHPYNPLSGPRPDKIISFAQANTDEQVSIIVIHRDCPNYLNLCLQSIAVNSVNNDYELIVVDNGSTKQDSVDFLDNLEELGDVKVIRNKENLWWSKAANQGAKSASKNSKYFIFMHADTVVLNSTWIDLLINIAESAGSGLVGLEMRRYEFDGQPADFVEEWCLLVSRDCWKDCGPWSEELPLIGHAFAMTWAASLTGHKPQIVQNHGVKQEDHIVHHYAIFGVDTNDFAVEAMRSEKILPEILIKMQEKLTKSDTYYVDSFRQHLIEITKHEMFENLFHAYKKIDPFFQQKAGNTDFSGSLSYTSPERIGQTPPSPRPRGWTPPGEPSHSSEWIDSLEFLARILQNQNPRLAEASTRIARVFSPVTHAFQRLYKSADEVFGESYERLQRYVQAQPSGSYTELMQNRARIWLSRYKEIDKFIKEVQNELQSFGDNDWMKSQGNLHQNFIAFAQAWNDFVEVYKQYIPVIQQELSKMLPKLHQVRPASNPLRDKMAFQSIQPPTNVPPKPPGDVTKVSPARIG